MWFQGAHAQSGHSTSLMPLSRKRFASISTTPANEHLSAFTACRSSPTRSRLAARSIRVGLRVVVSDGTPLPEAEVTGRVGRVVVFPNNRWSSCSLWALANSTLRSPVPTGCATSLPHQRSDMRVSFTPLVFPEGRSISDLFPKTGEKVEQACEAIPVRRSSVRIPWEDPHSCCETPTFPLIRRSLAEIARRAKGSLAAFILE